MATTGLSSIGQSYLDHTAVWTAVFAEALHSLNHEMFTLWLLGVGVFGSDEERARKGQELLPMMVRQAELAAFMKSRRPNDE